MVAVLPQNAPLQTAVGGLIPGLFQQLQSQNQQRSAQQDLLQLLGGGANLQGDQLNQIIQIAQQAGLQDTPQFTELLQNSGLFGKGEATPQSLLQLLLGGGAGLLQRGSQSLGDLAVGLLPGSVI